LRSAIYATAFDEKKSLSNIKKISGFFFKLSFFGFFFGLWRSQKAKKNPNPPEILLKHQKSFFQENSSKSKRIIEESPPINKIASCLNKSEFEFIFLFESLLLFSLSEKLQKTNFEK